MSPTAFRFGSSKRANFFNFARTEKDGFDTKKKPQLPRTSRKEQLQSQMAIQNISDKILKCCLENRNVSVINWHKCSTAMSNAETWAAILYTMLEVSPHEHNSTSFEYLCLGLKTLFKKLNIPGMWLYSAFHRT